MPRTAHLLQMYSEKCFLPFLFRASLGLLILFYFLILSKASPNKGQNKGNKTIVWCLLFHSSAHLRHKQQNPWLITTHFWFPGHSWSFPYGLFKTGTHIYISNTNYAKKCDHIVEPSHKRKIPVQQKQKPTFKTLQFLVPKAKQ